MAIDECTLKPVHWDSIQFQVVFAFFAFLDFFLELELEELELDESFAGAAFSVWLSCPGCRRDVTMAVVGKTRRAVCSYHTKFIGKYSKL